jgi:hypothetical protein
MKPTIAGVLADARALWRRERALLLPLAGMFFFVPMLGMALLLTGMRLSSDAAPEQAWAATMAFYEANLPVFFVIELVLNFGTFAVLNLFLQGNGRTLGEVLVLTLRRFLPFLAISIATRFLFGLGFSLFIVPGLLIFTRTWLVAPAYAAHPEQGIGAALRRGWRASAGVNGLVVLAMAAGAFFVSLTVGVFALAVATLIAGLVGGAAAATVAGYIALAAVGALAWLLFALLCVSLYRLTAPRQGI